MMNEIAQVQPLGMIDTILYMWNHWGQIQNQWMLVGQAFIGLVGAVATLASMITPLTKTPKDDAALAWVWNWIHQFSLINAKNVKGIGQNDTVIVPPQKTELPTKKG